MLNPEVLKEVKLHLNQHTVASILNHVGYEVDRSFKFRLRDEKTPSASIRADGFLKDFGGDFSGSIFDLLQLDKHMSFPQSVEYVAVCLGVEL